MNIAILILVPIFVDDKKKTIISLFYYFKISVKNNKK